MIKGLDIVSIPVRNQDAAIAFYTEKLGFRIHTDQPFDGTQRWIELSIPGAPTRIALFTPQGDEDRIGGFYPGTFACDNIERTYAELVARGVEFTAPPKKESWGTYAMFRDQDGNQFLLAQK
jgi:catechol 2,3-dioxygenase-like lactoylglutathione lyase family enzyme